MADLRCSECGQPQPGPHLGTCSGSLMHGGSVAGLDLRDVAVLAVVDERIAQEHEFPSVADDELTPTEWIARIAKHVGRAVTQDPPSFRREMVVVAALALAAIESYDRRFPE